MQSQPIVGKQAVRVCYRDIDFISGISGTVGWARTTDLLFHSDRVGTFWQLILPHTPAQTPVFIALGCINILAFGFEVVASWSLASRGATHGQCTPPHEERRRPPQTWRNRLGFGRSG